MVTFVGSALLEDDEHPVNARPLITAIATKEVALRMVFPFSLFWMDWSAIFSESLSIS